MTEEIQKSIDSLEEFKATVKRCCQEAEKLFEEIDADINEIKKKLKEAYKLLGSKQTPKATDLKQ